MLKENKVLSIGIKISVFIFVFVAITFMSSKITAYVTNDNPSVCKDINIKITDASLSADGKSLKIGIDNLGNIDVNGFNIMLVSENGNTKQKIFSTIRSGTYSPITLDYDRDRDGDIKKIVLMPVIIKDREVSHCTNIISYRK